MVSVIIPIYNTKVAYVKKCVDSLLKQTYDDFELILVDDGSTDKKLIKFLKSYKDKHINYLSKKNGGVSSARNFGIKAAKGEYLTFVDSDDWVEPDYLKNLVGGMTNCEMSIVGLDSRDIAKHLKEIKILSQVDLWELFLRPYFGGYLWNKIYRKNLVMEFLDESLFYAEDFLFNVKYSTNVERASFNPLPLYHYRQNSQSVCADTSYNKRILTLLNAFAQVENIYKQYSPSNLIYIQINLFKAALNIKGRYLSNNIIDFEGREKFEKVIDDYSHVIKECPAITEKINLFATYFFPGFMFKLKNFIKDKRDNVFRFLKHNMHHFKKIPVKLARSINNDKS